MMKLVTWVLVMSLIGGSAFAGEASKSAESGDESSEMPSKSKKKSRKVVEEEDDEDDNENLFSFSSAVNVIRPGSRLEVMFRNGESYILPRGSRQHKIFDALQESEKSGKPVTVTVDKRTNVIHSVSAGASTDKK